MRISIITPSYNQGRYIEDTIRSVMNQNHNDVEHIVVDGGSSDDTVLILKKYPHLKWISEKDKGQSNAINKGFQMSTGQIISWINSDDFYEENVFREIAEYFDFHPECQILYGDITYVAKDGAFLRKVCGETISYESLARSPDIVRQPSCFWRRSVVDELGGLDESLHIVMDFDFFLRVAEHCQFHYLNKNLSFFRSYGESKTNARQFRQAREFLKVYRKHRIRMDRHRLWFLAVRVLDSMGVGKTLRTLIRPFKPL